CPSSSCSSMPLIDTSSVTVTPYDFRRPPWISRERRAILDGLHARMAGELESVVAALTRPPVKLAVADAAQVTYGDWRASLTTPVAACLADLTGRDDQLLLLFEPALAANLVDRMLGGSGAGADGARGLTGVEQGVLRRLATALIDRIRERYAEVAPFTAGEMRFEDIVESLEPVGNHERILLLELELGFDTTAGRIWVALPADCIEALDRKSTRL